MNPARLNLNELHQLKWLLGTILSLIALWTLFYLDVSNQLFLAAAFLVVSAVLVFPRLPGRIPELIWKGVTPILIVLIVGDFFLHGGDFLPPLVRMITYLLVVRCLAYRRRREDLQLILLCLFMAVISGVLTMSLIFAFQIVIFTPVAMVLLFMVNLLESSKDRTLTLEDWDYFQWGHFIDHIRRVMDIKLIGFAGALFTLVVVVSSLIFVVMPRFRFDQAIPFLQLKSSSLTGFSETIELGGVTDIIEDDRVAMRLDAPSKELMPANPYFRMLVMDYYSNGQFSMSRSVRNNPNITRTFESNRINQSLYGRVSDTRGYEQPELSAGVWTFYLEGGISKYLPALGPFKTMRFQKRQEIDSNQTFLTHNLDSATKSVFSYQVWTMGPTPFLSASREDRARLPGAEPIVADRDSEVWATGGLEYPMTLLALPLAESDAAYLRRVVDEIGGAGVLGAEDFAERIIHYLQDRHAYSMASKVEDRGRDKIVAWMQDGVSGHCEYFAGAFTLIARAAGYPTRVVVGFNGGSWNTVEDYFVVRNRNAHAWCEIFDGTDTWIRMDPTPGGQRLAETGMAGGSRVLSEIQGWEAWVDSLRILWYRSIVNFDDESQRDLAAQFRDYGQVFMTEFKATGERWVSAVKTWVTQPLTLQRGLIYVGILLLIVVLVWLYRQRLIIQGRLMETGWGRRLMGNRPDPIRQKAGRLLVRYEAALEKINGRPELWEDTEAFHRVHLDLQSLRFGNLSNRTEALDIFKAARLMIRRAYRGG